MNWFLFLGYWLEADDTTKEIIELILTHFVEEQKNAPSSTAIPDEASSK